MSFTAANRARAQARAQSPSKLAEQVVRHLRERRILTNERNDAALLLLCLHHQGTGSSDAHGRPATVRLERGAEQLDVRIKWGSDGVPRIGPKTREALESWFARVPFPRHLES
jgi:hypothetical protein